MASPGPVSATRTAHCFTFEHAEQLGVNDLQELYPLGEIYYNIALSYLQRSDDVNIAARLQGMAQQGEVLISEATYDKVRDHITASKLETIALKGKSRHIDVFRIDSLRHC